VDDRHPKLHARAVCGRDDADPVDQSARVPPRGWTRETALDGDSSNPCRPERATDGGGRPECDGPTELAVGDGLASRRVGRHDDRFARCLAHCRSAGHTDGCPGGRLRAVECRVGRVTPVDWSASTQRAGVDERPDE
jgi:hypothetical protein